jgi:hypothetical protein
MQDRFALLEPLVIDDFVDFWCAHRGIIRRRPVAVLRVLMMHEGGIAGRQTRGFFEVGLDNIDVVHVVVIAHSDVLSLGT